MQSLCLASTPEAILHGKPMGTPMLFPDALQLERNLELNFWDEEFPDCVRFRSEVCDPEGNTALVLSSDLQQHWHFSTLFERDDQKSNHDKLVNDSLFRDWFQ